MLGEFAIIAKYFAPLTGGDPAALGLTDDAALLTPKPGHQLVITKDMLVEGVHFFPRDDPYTLAQKALRVNLSDLAAKGAKPLGYFLGLTLPNQVQEPWIEQFSKGLQEDNNRFDVKLLGGDTTAHPGGVIISMTAFGEIPIGQALLRSGAAPGDGVYMSGTLGDSALGLALLQGHSANIDPSTREFLLSRYYLPRPQVALGQALRPIASACMDISDGLLQDAGHLADCSRVGIEIHAAALPLSEAAMELLAQDGALLETIMTGGDDYELLFTVPPARERELHGMQAARIGQVKEGSGVQVYDAGGELLTFPKGGYRHF